MRITKLILKNYKRLMMSNIRTFEYRPTKVMQLLIGSNGSGKSSVLDELTPVPAHHNAFTTGGLKEVHLEHQQSVYVLRSEYNGGSGKHSFKKDGEELNKGHTSAVQRELVEREFKLTRAIHELLTDQVTFTSMETSKRREWLTRLSPIDLSYAFAQYNQHRTHARDQVGVIKHIAKRMMGEDTYVPDEHVMQQLRDNLKRLNAKLTTLFEYRKPSVRPAFVNQTAVAQELEQLLDRARQLLRLQPQVPVGVTFESRDEFQAELTEQVAQHRTLVAVVDQMIEELEAIQQKTPSKDEALSAEQVDEIRRYIATTETAIAEHRVKVDAYQGVFPLIQFDITGNPKQKLTTLFDRWIALLSSFPENPDGRMNSVDARNNKNRLQELRVTLRGVEDRQATNTRRLATLRGCTDVVCPACEHTFKPGVDVQEVTRLEIELTALNAQQGDLEKQVKALEEWLQEYDHYAGFVYNFRQLVNDHHEFHALWDTCITQEVMYRTPRRFINAAVEWHAVMEHQVEAALLSEQLAVMQNKLKYVEAINQDTVGYLTERQAQLEAQIEGRSHEAARQKRRVLELEQTGKTLNTLERDIQSVLAQLTHYAQRFQQQVEYLVQQALEEETRLTHLQLADQQAQLNQLEQREEVVRGLERDHRDAVQLQHDFGLIVKALSPTDGLIGRYLMGFMQVVVKLMNAVIGEIWTYPLEVLPSKVEKDELDYNFPLSVKNGQLIAPDIRRGSASQRDVVDFAFKLMVMKFLHLEDYPLYLDEFGSTFDEQHRENLVPFLVNLIDLGQAQQVFYVSHYISTHGAFNQAEVCVLDATNIVVPQVYNQHITIE